MDAASEIRDGPRTLLVLLEFTSRLQLLLASFFFYLGPSDLKDHKVSLEPVLVQNYHGNMLGVAVCACA